MDPEEVRRMIEQGLPGARVQVHSDDNTHFQAVVIANAFADLGRIGRHQLVYRCLGERMGNEIHALSIRAYTEAEWQQQNP